MGIVDWENLYLASQAAAKGKRERQPVMEFFANLEINLMLLQEELTNKSYSPGRYKTFSIYDPKPRMISAAPFKDRVVHHALMNVIGPILEAGFIDDIYANRAGKGTHKAIQRFQFFLQRYRFVLKCDIKKYFPSIDHEILKKLIQKKIADQEALWLINTILAGSNEQINVVDYFPGDDLLSPVQRRKGLPIGNLTSQNFANFYLNEFDHFVKEKLRCHAYLRYVDDFVLLANNKQQLHKWLAEMVKYLETLRLKLHPNRCDLFPATMGRRFLGQVVAPDLRRLPGENVRSFSKRLRRWQKHPPENMEQRISSWLGHAQQADTTALLRNRALLT